MKSARIRSAKPDWKAQAPQQEPKAPPLPSDERHLLIAKRAYEIYADRGYRHGYALENWLDAEREILSRLPPS
jgi:hypothetical protein